MTQRHDVADSRDGFRTINFALDLYTKIQEIAKRRDTNIRKLVNDTMSDVVTREELSTRIEPFLKILVVDEKSIFIKDQRGDGSFAQVSFRNDNDKFKVECVTDKKEDCIHVSFALGFLANNPLGRFLNQ